MMLLCSTCDFYMKSTSHISGNKPAGPGEDIDVSKISAFQGPESLHALWPLQEGGVDLKQVVQTLHKATLDLRALGHSSS